MRGTVYVCDEHKFDSQTREAYRHILSHDSGAFTLGPRAAPEARFIDLTQFGINWDTDLQMDEGL